MDKATKSSTQRGASFEADFMNETPSGLEVITICSAPIACRNASGLWALTLPSLSPTTLTLPSTYRQERGDLY